MTMRSANGADTRPLSVTIAAVVALAGTPEAAANGTAPTPAVTSNVSEFSGAFGTRVPITVPAFRGLEPKLELVYTSSGGNGWVGHGWALAGVSFIERAASGQGAPRYDANDVYFLDGNELMPSSALGGTHVTRVQNFQRIQHDPATNHWTVRTRDGTKITFAPLLAYPEGVFRWAQTQVEDVSGRSVAYTYACSGEDCSLTGITYGATTITFHQEARPDPITFATGLSMAKLGHRLKTIDIKVGGERARAYAIGYRKSASTGRSLVEQIRQFGRDAQVDAAGNVSGESLPALTMDHHDSGSYTWATKYLPADVFTAVGRGPAETSQSGYSDGGVRFADINGDGRQDILRAVFSCAPGGACYSQRDTFLAMPGTGGVGGYQSGPALPGQGYFTLTRSDGGPDSAATDGGLRVADINGDGKADLLFALWECGPHYGPGCQSHHETWLGTGTSFVPGPPLPSSLFFAISPASAHVRHTDGGVRIFDMNGDGQADLVQSLWECDDNYGPGCSAQRHIWLNTGTAFVPGPAVPGAGYFAMPRGGAAPSSGYTDGGLRLADLNGDGLGDFALALWECDGNYGEGCAAHLESWLGTGSSFIPGPAMPGYYFALPRAGSTAAGGYSDGGLRIADVNGPQGDA
jgi:hypothetical protein